MLRVKRGLDQVIDKTTRGMDKIRIECAGRDDFLHLRNDPVSGSGSRLVKVVFGHTVLQVADRIRPPGPDDRDIGM